MKLVSEVPASFSPAYEIDHNSSVLLLGSCVSEELASRLSSHGFNVLSNPFGPLYNPASVLNALQRIADGTPFTSKDCTLVGGTDRTCSHFFHTLASKSTEAEFLTHANEVLENARNFVQNAEDLVIIVTLGTSYVWLKEGTVVNNCLKRPASEFSKSMLSVPVITSCLRNALKLFPSARWIFGVCPIRHFSDGPHENTLSKAQLHLALENIAGYDYFPCWEVVMDELRDYRYFSRDLFHLSDVAVDILFEKFMVQFFSPETIMTAAIRHKEFLRSQHKQLL